MSTVTLTLKSNRAKGDKRGFFRGGVFCPPGWAPVEVLEAAVEALKKEPMVLIADDMKAAELVKEIGKLNDAAQVKVLMAVKDAATVQKAGADRLDFLGHVEPEPGEEVPTAKELKASKKDLLEKVKAADTLEALSAHADAVAGFTDAAMHKELSDAYSAREKELGG